MALSVEHLRRTYGTFVAVDDLSFEVGAGEIVGLIGPNGAGKTTTLRSLTGILKPTSGRVRIDEHDIVAAPIEAKRRLAFMPDEPHLFDYLTVTEHLRLMGRLYAIPDIDRRAAGLLAELELAGKERALPERALAWHAAEGRHRVRPGPGRDDAPVRRAADGSRSNWNQADAVDHCRARARRAPRSCCRRTCFTSWKRSAPASIIMDRGRKIADGTVAELASRNDLLRQAPIWSRSSCA